MRVLVVAALSGLLPLLVAPTAQASSGADLRVVPLDPDPAPAGGTTVVRAFVANGGPGAAGAFTVVVRLPVGTRAVGPYFPDDCRADPGARVVRCAFPAGLGELRSATARVPVRLADWAAGTLLGGEVRVESADDPDQSNDTGSYLVRVADGASDQR